MSAGSSPETTRPTSPTVLVVMAQPAIRELVRAHCQSAGAYAMAAATLDEGWRLANEVLPDAVVIDLDALPAQPGAIAAPRPLGVPVVMLTSRLDERCGAHGERCGATWCITKPFSPRALVRDLLDHLSARESPTGTEAPGAAGDGSLTGSHGPWIEVDAPELQLRLRRGAHTQTVTLAPREMQLLRQLLEHAERIVPRHALLAEVWKDVPNIDARTVDQYIRRLRRRLAQTGVSPDLIQTVRGAGYRLALQGWAVTHASDASASRPARHGPWAATAVTSVKATVTKDS